MDFTRRPWNPDPRWADPLIVFLALLLGLLFNLSHSQAPASQPPGQASLEGRELEIRFALQRRVSLKDPLPNPWDARIQAILEAEEGRSEPCRKSPISPSHADDALFQRVFEESFCPETPAQPLAKADHQRLQNALRNGLAFHILTVRHQQKLAPPQTAARFQKRVDDRIHSLQRRCILLGSGLLVAALAGLVGVGLILLRPKAARPSGLALATPLPWRAVALVFLTWLLALALSGTFAQLLTHALSLPAPWRLFSASLFHIAIGLTLICKAQGLGWRDCGKHLAQRPSFKTLAWTALFLGIALWTVIAANVLTAPLTRHLGSPQQDLREMVTAEQGLLGHLLIFLPIGVLAPFFEEVLFRGFLLPWLGNAFRQKWKTGAWPGAIALSGILFGFIHFQPAAAPSLSALGIVLGWAFVRTGNLWAAILIHACWNTGTWIIMRTLLA